MNVYEQSLHINDSAFESMRADADRVLQRLLKNMVEKDSLEGKVTITIDVSLIQEYIPNRDPNVEGETRRTLTPKLSHKVGSVMQIKNEAKGDTNYDGMEMVWDDEKKEYVLRPVANTEQMTIFDTGFMQKDQEEKESHEESDGPKAIEGSNTPLLPAPDDENVIDGDFREVESEEDSEPEAGEDLEDITDELLGKNSEDDGYSYEEPLPFEEGEADDDCDQALLGEEVAPW